MTIDKHIYFTKEEYLRIKDYASNNSLPYSKAVCELCVFALNSNEVIDKINKLNKNLEYLIRKQKISHALIEQIYSDMDFDNLTNPKKSKPLNEFNKRVRNNINE